MIGAPVAAVAVLVAAAGATAVVGGGGDPQQGTRVGPPNGHKSAPEASTTAVAKAVYTGGAIDFKRVVTWATPPVTTTSTVFLPLLGTGPPDAVVPVAKHQKALINVRFTAESRCSGGNGIGDWCEVRILIGGVEADPAASAFPPDTFALDSTNNGAETTNSWEGHALERHRCVVGTDVAMNVPVVVEWRVMSFGAIPPEFWLDDWSLAIERSTDASCP
jgi:hypothetical protein